MAALAVGPGTAERRPLEPEEAQAFFRAGGPRAARSTESTERRPRGLLRRAAHCPWVGGGFSTAEGVPKDEIFT